MRGASAADDPARCGTSASNCSREAAGVQEDVAPHGGGGATRGALAVRCGVASIYYSFISPCYVGVKLRSECDLNRSPKAFISS